MNPKQVSPDGPGFGLLQKCILVVEDEFLIRFMLAEELRDAGYQVIEASQATEALTVLESVRPDLIISDVRMPGPVDGLGLLASIRDMIPSLPVIIVSGHLHRTQALAEGATQFVAKPYLFETVLAAVRAGLEKTP